jgi:ubiquinol-cytochrome c reductase cytochrome c1 subunit
MRTLKVAAKSPSTLISILLLSAISSLLMSSASASNSSCGTYTEPDPVHPKQTRQRDYTCRQAPIDINDHASLQRGATLFMNNCASCHSLKYLRLERMAKDLSIPPALIEQYMKLSNGKVSDGIDAKMDPALQKKIFGTVPPDLSVETRAHSPDWVYTYLLSFYPDQTRPFGVNNTVIHDVAMPNVLDALHQQVGDPTFHKQVGDLVNFLNYAAEPAQRERKIYGIFVILFLFIFLIPVYLLYKEYWKDVK